MTYACILVHTWTAYLIDWLMEWLSHISWSPRCPAAVIRWTYVRWTERKHTLRKSEGNTKVTHKNRVDWRKNICKKKTRVKKTKHEVKNVYPRQTTCCTLRILILTWSREHSVPDGNLPREGTQIEWTKTSIIFIKKKNQILVYFDAWTGLWIFRTPLRTNYRGEKRVRRIVSNLSSTVHTIGERFEVRRTRFANDFNSPRRDFHCTLLFSFLVFVFFFPFFFRGAREVARKTFPITGELKKGQ